MVKFGENFRNIFKIQELRTRLLYTAALLIVVRIGAHITLPGVDAVLLAKAEASQAANTLFGLYDLFVGGAFKNAAIFALGIMPYISSSIILQLLGAVVPYFQKLSKEGEEGRKKLTQLTRYGTVVVSALQGWGVSVRLSSLQLEGLPIVPVEVQGFAFTVSTVIFLTAGTIGIIARFPHSIVDQFRVSQNLIIGLIILAVMVAIIAGVVLVTQGTRRIPVQYAKRVVGRKVYGGVTQYIPLRVNTAGVMPIIFAQSIMFIPQTILTFFPESEFMQTISEYFSYTSFTYAFFYGVMIVFFTYFYTAIAFNPKDVSENMQKQGGFIPGIRPGKHTADFIDNILTKITLPGSIFLAVIAILPAFVSRFGVTPSFSQFFGGTSLLIMVGVALDTLQQVESHLLMRHYDGFMKSGKLKGRLR
jgi:preprotein translocase subunit SecY